MAEKYPLTEKQVKLQKQQNKRWEYTLSGWIRLIRTDHTEEGREMERQIQNRMWEDPEFDRKIRDEFDVWLAEEPLLKLEELEDELRLSKRKSVRYGGHFKGRGHGEKKREP